MTEYFIDRFTQIAKEYLDICDEFDKTTENTTRMNINASKVRREIHRKYGLYYDDKRALHRAVLNELRRREAKED